MHVKNNFINHNSSKILDLNVIPDALTSICFLNFFLCYNITIIICLFDSSLFLNL